MRPVKRTVLTVLALSLLLVVPFGVGTAWAAAPGPAQADGFTTAAWADLPGNAQLAQVAADESYCTPVAGPGVKMTFYCDIKVRSTLWVYCEGVTIEVRLNPGRWAPSGSCPGYRGYRLVPSA